MNSGARRRSGWLQSPLALLCVAMLGHGAAHAQAPALQAPATQAPAAAGRALWWPGFIDARGKAFLELADDTKLCALARDALRKAAAEAGRVITLPLKVETLLPRDARLAFGVIDTAGHTSERVMPRVVTIARGTDKGACAHIAEAGAEAPGYTVEEDRTAFGVHPPRPLLLRAPLDAWKSFGQAGAPGTSDARFVAAADAPPAWRARVTPFVPAPLEVFGQRFAAVLERGREATLLALNGAIAVSPEFDTLNLIAREGLANPVLASSVGSLAQEGQSVTLLQSGPSGGFVKNRAGSFVAQVVGALDLDGDGVDEIVLRARYYSGGNLKILKFSGGKLIEVRQSAYEGE